jgi:lipopolysaccharide transport system ATP-binding protein
MQSSLEAIPAPAMMAIQAKNVGVYYPPTNSFFSKKKKNKEGFWAIQDLSFELNKGDILGLVGPNGAGKSTAMSVIGNIISPDRGSINTFGHSVMLLTLNAGLSPNLSGRKNIFLTGLTLGISKEVISEKIEEIIAFADIGDFIDKPVNTYSTGMKSRLGFSTALYLEPEIFLIDEALGVGDKDFRKKSTLAMRKKLSKNVTAIIVSHNDETIRSLCTKAVLMQQGRSVAYGSPDEVLKIYNAT